MQNKVKSPRFIHIDIMLTLTALAVMQYFYYGMRTVVLVSVCLIVSFVTEIISLRLMKRKFTADHLTCLSDALMIVLMLPASVDYRIAALACIFASAVSVNVFGGRKEHIFSPAAAAYVFLLTSWKNEILMFTAPHVHVGILEKATNLVSSASHSFNLTGRMNATDFELIMGNVSGATGAVSILLLIVTAVILILRRDISAGAFIGMISGTSLLALAVPMCPDPINSLKYTFANNMVLFAAIYIISDKRIAPQRIYYAFFYGLFIAVFSYIFVITTAKENAVVIVSVLFTPIALGLRNLEKRIDVLKAEEAAARAEAEIGEEAETYEQ